MSQRRRWQVRRRFGAARLTPRHVGGEAIQGCREVGIIYVPERMPCLVLRKLTNDRNQLPETQLRASSTNLIEPR
jgi:hypothetical protein